LKVKLLRRRAAAGAGNEGDWAAWPDGAERYVVASGGSMKRIAYIGSDRAPSEVRHPRSTATVTFLRPMAGKLQGCIVSSDIAGAAQLYQVNDR